MRVRLGSKVYADLALAMEYYIREAGVQIAKEFYDEFNVADGSSLLVRDHIRLLGAAFAG